MTRSNPVIDSAVAGDQIRSKESVDATHNIAPETELRRRAAEGDQLAVAELARRSVEQVGERAA